MLICVAADLFMLLLKQLFLEAVNILPGHESYCVSIILCPILGVLSKRRGISATSNKNSIDEEQSSKGHSEYSIFSIFYNNLLFYLFILQITFFKYGGFTSSLLHLSQLEQSQNPNSRILLKSGSFFKFSRMFQKDSKAAKSDGKAGKIKVNVVRSKASHNIFNPCQEDLLSARFIDHSVFFPKL